MTITMSAEVLLDCEHALGESALWDADRQLFCWVDIPSGSLHTLDLVTGAHRSTVMGEGLLVNVVLAEDGSLVLANERDIYRYDDATGQTALLWTVDEGRGLTRLNDGAADPAGRLVIGTLAYDTISPVGGLYSLEHTVESLPATAGRSDVSVAQRAQQRQLLGGITISNGLGWSPDGSLFYHVDSPTRTIRAFDYDTELGSIRQRGTLATINTADAVPDGLTVDAEGCVWVALWGGSALHRYTPQGVLDTVVEIAAPYVTSCIFGGPDRGTLLITTARDGGEPAVPVAPLGGALFALTPGVVGQPERRVRVNAM